MLLFCLSLFLLRWLHLLWNLYLFRYAICIINVLLNTFLLYHLSLHRFLNMLLLHNLLLTLLFTLFWFYYVYTFFYTLYLGLSHFFWCFSFLHNSFRWCFFVTEGVIHFFIKISFLISIFRMLPPFAFNFFNVIARYALGGNCTFRIMQSWLFLTKCT